MSKEDNFYISNETNSPVVDELKSRISELEVQNAVMRDYLSELYQFEKENGVRDRDSIALKALSLSDVSEMVRKKED